MKSRQSLSPTEWISIWESLIKHECHHEPWSGFMFCLSCLVSFVMLYPNHTYMFKIIQQISIKLETKQKATTRLSLDERWRQAPANPSPKLSKLNWPYVKSNCALNLITVWAMFAASTARMCTMTGKSTSVGLKSRLWLGQSKTLTW